MTKFSPARLSAFVKWASQVQADQLAAESPWVTTIGVGKATGNRLVSLKAELFKVERTGWIGNELERGGQLTLWENGCADAEFLDSAQSDEIVCDHWDDVEPDQFDSLFAPFLAKLRD